MQYFSCQIPGADVVDIIDRLSGLKIFHLKTDDDTTWHETDFDVITTDIAKIFEDWSNLKFKEKEVIRPMPQLLFLHTIHKGYVLGTFPGPHYQHILFLYVYR